jgi:hypothetical protein
MKTTRMSTLVKKLGAPVSSHKFSMNEYAKAVNENRVLSIHSSDEENGADYGVPGHNSVNVVSRVVFPNPISGGVEYVNGFNKPEYYGQG